MPRVKKSDSEVVGTPPPPNNYFAQPSPYSFVRTGCSLLDCALGGGWALGRVANLVGDRSTGKTALGVEALINFCQQYPKGKTAYRDVECAFDAQYAEHMGLKLDKVDFGDPDKPLTTVEDFAQDLEKFVDECDGHGIYVLDSLDALTTESELKQAFGDQGYGTAKAKLLSELFRKLTSKINQSNVLLLIVSQLRDNIGVMMGEKHKRSGGRSLDFYASQIVWLARIKTLERTQHKIKRAYGVRVKASVKKNKVGLERRTCEFDFLYGYGAEDLGASLGWLEDAGLLKQSGFDKLDIEAMDTETYRKTQALVDEVVKREWAEADERSRQKRRKYD